MRWLSSFSVLLWALALSGCASIVTGTYQDLAVTTEPPGAACQLEEMSHPVATIQATPAVVRVPRSEFPLEVFCAKDAEAGDRILDPELEPWALGNVVTGGIGYLVDSWLRADYRYPEAAFVTFRVKSQ